MTEEGEVGRGRGMDGEEGYGSDQVFVGSRHAVVVRRAEIVMDFGKDRLDHGEGIFVTGVRFAKEREGRV